MREGLSPRVRGNRSLVPCARLQDGSIPACAGEPTAASRAPRRIRVYPRVCGGTIVVVVSGERRPGLSPRVRGNLIPMPRLRDLFGSIPACAGEPSRRSSRGPRSRVYPRVCGGTATSRDSRRRRSGLSPRVRGNRRSPPEADLAFGSIPACAGEPPRPPTPSSRNGVYPRVCGGTISASSSATRSTGLSPRVRGNRGAVVRPGRSRGSIPACAGEPGLSQPAALGFWVYPRVCGGTVSNYRSTYPIEGLSPRVRGNQARAWPRAGPGGSIPACAGEPLGRAKHGLAPRVYPRVCGGTPAARGGPFRPPGLSPRVRGNRSPVSILEGIRGSIPACAGEPTLPARVPRCSGVYPRVCGGTDNAPYGVIQDRGLSPRVRGNLLAILR